jgi:zinc protease
VQREAWSIFTHPQSEKAAECIALELDLLRAFVEEGVTIAELGSARDYLIKSHAFDRDTASKRLEPRLDSEVQGMPEDFYTRYVEHVGTVTLARANESVRARLSHEDVSIVLVATAKDLGLRLEVLPGVREVEVIPFSAV